MSEKDINKTIRKFGKRANIFLTVALLLICWAHFSLIDQAIAHNKELGMPLHHTNGFLLPGLGLAIFIAFNLSLYVFHKVLTELLANKK